MKDHFLSLCEKHKILFDKPFNISWISYLHFILDVESTFSVDFDDRTIENFSSPQEILTALEACAALSS